MGPVRITKFGHSCVRLSAGGSDVVIDPGGWSEREALDGVAAVLVTHEHPDHWTIDHLRATDAPVWTMRRWRAVTGGNVIVNAPRAPEPVARGGPSASGSSPACTA